MKDLREAMKETCVQTLAIFITVIYLLQGMFLDPIGIVVLTLLLVESYDLNLIRFGVVMIKMLEVGLVTPPVGLKVCVIANVVGREAPIDRIFVGITRVLSVDITAAILIMSFPMISLLIPMTAQ